MNEEISLLKYHSLELQESFVLNLRTGTITPTEKTVQTCVGFWARDRFLFPSRNLASALFVDDGVVYFYFEGKLFEVNESFSLRRTSFLLYVRITIRYGNLVFKYWQRERDIDPFYMDDFFYYLEFMLKNHRSILTENWPNVSA